MKIQHARLAQGRWREMSFLHQMANIGSEVERFLNWRAKGNHEYSQRARDRALELLDLTLDAHRRKGRLREVARVREALVDFSEGTNAFDLSEDFWRRYFTVFTLAARRDR